MKKQAAAALLAMLCSVAAKADQTYWFKYKGFNDSAGRFNADATVAGYFTANDADRDGVIRLDELNSLVTNGYSFTGCNPENPVVHCGTSAFTYVIGGALSFEGGYGVSDEMYVQSTTVSTGDFYRSYSDNAWGGAGYYHYFTWTPQTQLTISTPVPEPATYGMLATGLLAVGAVARRRRKN
ncbi:PEP-CTERM sorting domain-containing protein [Massilia sp. YIM B04103]|uniref:PEP-CTERM sorting domain-containing protein n=1 Tax=Massilia sp. YIM B04103 TaxID=2963106 RepID=UPI00210A1F90|nr:PEP-CTERM sorting domain-containing protein [Massilia sp. YIM B04103]